MARFFRRFIPHCILLSVMGLSVFIAVTAASKIPLPNQEHDYNVARFTVKHVWSHVADVVTAPFRAEMSQDQQDALILRFLDLNAMIRDGERIAGDPTTDPDVASDVRRELEAWITERKSIENRVEKIFQARLTEAIRDSGLTRRFGTDVVWPPVKIEFEQTPSVLVVSPRDEIRGDKHSLLRGDLPLERVERIEAEAERGGDASALVVRIGGIAMYPAIIPPSSNYRFLLDDIAHEWVHHYLWFAPLGRRYAQSGELITLNETVANMVGKELGAMMLERYPMPNAKGYSGGGGRLAAPAVRVDVRSEMQELRQEVEVLLARGELEAAEQRMEEKRQFLAVNGHYIRRLNQAYFAFHGSYADGIASINPIGPKLEQLRELSDSLEEFVRTAQDLRSERDLDAAIVYALRR